MNIVNPHLHEFQNLRKLKWYFNRNVDNYNRMIKFFRNESSDISVSFIEWFVCVYCRKNILVIYANKDTGKLIQKDNSPTTKMIVVYDDYNRQIDYYTKKMFDPYARGSKFIFEIDNSNYSIITSIGQLNYFKWLYENGIMDYIEQNYPKLIKYRKYRK